MKEDSWKSKFLYFIGYDYEMSWKWNLSHRWYKITGPFRRFFRWIIKSTQYFIMLKNDYDFDYSYLLRMMQYKISRMRRCISKNNQIVRTEEVCMQLLHAEELIRKIREEDFCSDLNDAHEKKWGAITQWTKEVQRNGETFHQLKILREKTETEELRLQEQAEQRLIYDKMKEEKQKCWNELFDHMKKHMVEWWD